MTQSGRVLIAADKFKGSLTAAEVAEHVAAGIRRARPGTSVVSLPVADGGDGTVDAVVAGGFDPVEVEVTGPLGLPVAARFALRGETAVVEMAQASGLVLLPQRTFAPMTATTYGTGELIAAALDAGASRVILGVGGSATTDGGAGMLTALGATLLDEDGDPLPWGGGPLRELASADLSGLDPRLKDTEFVLASDVDNPLTGPTGAASVYGPQKGADPLEVEVLDGALAHFAEVLERTEGERVAELAEAPGAGAAGGIGFGALLGLNATFRPGIEVLLEVLGFAEALAEADLVITGEGSLDEQTLRGKAPAGVAARARAAGRRVLAVCGRLSLDAETLAEAGIEAAYPLTALEPNPRRSIDNAGPLLERVAARLAEEHLDGASASGGA
ncbi:glycerate kinase [Streptomyces triticirhizae]|uniref:Glycerate kinase n=1 Tax=Streptomyces triticirhizae TaxID=2483353 RepID=A0A3M2L5Y6_9ACTN|nr:glycerate kinase [Streptomyces triticirhizae]RMI33112.1 glycerate kinase [Streptomyces triticirhizae]